MEPKGGEEPPAGTNPAGETVQAHSQNAPTETRRVGMVKVSEPKATVHIAMKEIGEHLMHFRDSQSTDGRRFYYSKSQNYTRGWQRL